MSSSTNDESCETIRIINLCSYDIKIIVKDADGTESENYYPVHTVNDEKTIARAFVLVNRIRIDRLENGIELYDVHILDSVIGMPPECQSSLPPNVIVPDDIARILKETYFGAVYAPDTRPDQVIYDEGEEIQTFKHLYQHKSRGWPANKQKDEYSIEEVLLKLEHSHSTDIKTVAVMFEDAVTGFLNF